MGIVPSDLSFNTKYQIMTSSNSEMLTQTINFSKDTIMSINNGSTPIMKVNVLKNELFVTPWSAKTKHWEQPINFI